MFGLALFSVVVSVARVPRALLALGLASSMVACASARPERAPAAARGGDDGERASRPPSNARSPDRPTMIAPPETTENVSIAGQTRPRRLSGEDPQCTPEANERFVSATIFAKCVIRPGGNLEQCRLLRGDATGLGAEVLRVLPGWRMTPVVYKGERVAVEYGFPFRFQCAPASN